MAVKIRQKGSYLYLDCYWKGSRHWEALGLQRSTDKAQDKEIMHLAEVARSKREAQLFAAEHGLLDKTGGKVSLVGFAETIAATMPIKSHVPRSIKYMKEHFRALQLSAVDERSVEAYRDFLLRQPRLGPTTARHYQAALTHVLRRAVLERKIERDPSITIKKIKAPESVKRAFTLEEIRALAATAPATELGAAVAQALFFGLNCGLRVSDIRSLKWGDVIRGEHPHIKKLMAKTSRYVEIPLSPAAWKFINDGRLHKADELVFPRLATKTDHHGIFHDWAERAGLDWRFGWHTARHTFATFALAEGADISTVSRLLGHRDLSTTMVYAKTSDGAKRRAVDALPSIELKEARK